MSGEGICSRLGCDRPVDCRGLCRTQYNQIRFEGRVCSEEGCQRTQKATGLCQLHYNRQRLAGQVCEVEGCDRPVRAAGLCTFHYDRRRAYGKWNGEIGYCECGCGLPTEVSTITDPGRGAVIGKPRRFLPGHNAQAAMSPDAVRVERREFPTPCWIWQRGKTNGYGVASAGSHAQYAHRLAYERAKGPVPAGWHVHHLCWDKTCVNPDHLIAVTPTANAQGCLNGPACTESPNTWIPRERGRRLRLGPGELPYEVRDMGYESPCWIWRRPLARGGYPRHYLRADEVPPGGRREVSAHRHYYERNVGPIPPGLVLDHLCNNPPCVNPAHLEPVTAKENMRRKIERQRRASIALFAAAAAG